MHRGGQRGFVPSKHDSCVCGENLQVTRSYGVCRLFSILSSFLCTLPDDRELSNASCLLSPSEMYCCRCGIHDVGGAVPKGMNWTRRPTHCYFITLALVLVSSPVRSFQGGSKRLNRPSMPSPVAIVSTSLLPTASLSTAAALVTTQLSNSVSSNNESMIPQLSPRPRSIVYMAVAMSLHFGGYEFFRNACLAIFTSTKYGFTSPSAFPLAGALVSPFSIFLLWLYGRTLEQVGPRRTLFRCTAASIVFIATACTLLSVSQGLPHYFSQAVIGLTFLFQSSYQYLLYTQQWSFVSSVLTPDEGSKWITIITGCSSIVCSSMGALVPVLGPRTGLLGLMACTCITLVGTLFFSDAAYRLSEENGFDPTEAKPKKAVSEKSNRFVEARKLFRRVPALAALFTETVMYQSLGTILNVAFVTKLKATIPDDLARSAYTSRCFVGINVASAVVQLIIAPFVVARTEPSLLWKIVPVIPLGMLLYGRQTANPLTMFMVTWATVKVLDYALRSVLTVLVYQPLDYESRYMGKEIIGVLGSRLGKSAVSLALSSMVTNASIIFAASWVGGFGWLGSALWLSQIIPSKKRAQEIVEERQKGKQD